MLSPWIIRTFTFPPLLASLVSCIALSHLESWCKLCRCIQTLRSITYKPPYTFLKTATIPTYYGISIAIPRYIAMQLSIISFMKLFIIVILLSLLQGAANATLRSETLQRNCVRCNNRKWWCKKP